jgi:hypothetical protein
MPIKKEGRQAGGRVDQDWRPPIIKPPFQRKMTRFFISPGKLLLFKIIP